MIKGIGNQRGVIHGKVSVWEQGFFKKTLDIKNRIIYFTENPPLYLVAFVEEMGCIGIILNNGNLNSHPLIFLKDSGTPAIVGAGNVSFKNANYILNSNEGVISLWESKDSIESNKDRSPINKLSEISTEFYSNVGFIKSIQKSGAFNFKGIGILRIEFLAVRTLAKNLFEKFEDGQLVIDFIEGNSEADAIYKLAEDPVLKNKLKNDIIEVIDIAMEEYRGKEIYIRSIDIAKELTDQMGNRGIRRCLSQQHNGTLFNLLCRAIYTCLSKKNINKTRIGIMLPLVSSYLEISKAANLVLKNGLSLNLDTQEQGRTVLFGWKLESPSSVINLEEWLEAFYFEFNMFPHILGVGSNDLTQFLQAINRDAEQNNDYLIYDDNDLSVFKMLSRISNVCAGKPIKKMIHGELGSNPKFHPIFKYLNFDISISATNLESKIFSHLVEKYDINTAIEELLQAQLRKYPEEIRVKISPIIKSKIHALIYG